MKQMVIIYGGRSVAVYKEAKARPSLAYLQTDSNHDRPINNNPYFISGGAHTRNVAPLYCMKE